jgi:hypothetical protein
MSGRVYFESTETYIFDSEGRLIRTWFACNGCGKIHESKKSAEECCSSQKAAVPKYMVCMRCSSVFTNMDAFEAHRELGCLRAVNEAVNVIELHTCLSCGSTLTSRAALESHLRWHESRAPQTKIVFTQDGRLVGSAFMTGKPQLRFISEALNSRDQFYCFRCRNPLPQNRGLRIILKSGRSIYACLSCFVLASFGDL